MPQIFLGIFLILLIVVPVFVYDRRRAVEDGRRHLLDMLRRTPDDSLHLVRFGKFRANDRISMVLLGFFKKSFHHYHLRIETTGVKKRYRLQHSLDWPGPGWLTKEHQGQIGDEVWTATLALISAATDLHNLVRDEQAAA
ncbi:MAG: hypothetical protein WC866_06140 [Patescibacteria group bacterium]|jgi:hypothetical protein